MYLLSLILLSISLSIDALGIGIAYSIRKIIICIKSRVIISSISLAVTYIAIAFGNFILKILNKNIAKLIGVAMLLIYGAITLYQGIKKESLNCDFDASKHIDIKESIFLGLALSIDSFGGGLSYAICGYNSNIIPILVGILQFIFLSVGILIGNKISINKRFKSNHFIILSGLIFIFLAIFRLTF